MFAVDTLAEIVWRIFYALFAARLSPLPPAPHLRRRVDEILERRAEYCTPENEKSFRLPGNRYAVSPSVASVRRLIICAWIWQHGPWETQRGREKERKERAAKQRDSGVVFHSFLAIF